MEQQTKQIVTVTGASRISILSKKLIDDTVEELKEVLGENVFGIDPLIMTEEEKLRAEQFAKHIMETQRELFNACNITSKLRV